MLDREIYHTSSSHESMGVNREALQLHSVYKKPYFLLQVTRESISVLQVTRESVSVLQVTWKSVSGTASHARCIWTCNEIEGSYDKIIITIVPSYTGKNITRLLPLALLLVLRTRNNTDGNKFLIFSSIASYYGDNYDKKTPAWKSYVCKASHSHSVYNRKPYMLDCNKSWEFSSCVSRCNCALVHFYYSWAILELALDSI